MTEKKEITRAEVDKALKSADDILLYAQARGLFSIEKKMEKIIEVIVELDGR